jgi:hypothetical protein
MYLRWRGASDTAAVEAAPHPADVRWVRDKEAVAGEAVGMACRSVVWASLGWVRAGGHA